MPVRNGAGLFHQLRESSWTSDHVIRGLERRKEVLCTSDKTTEGMQNLTKHYRAKCGTKERNNTGQHS